MGNSIIVAIDYLSDWNEYLKNHNATKSKQSMTNTNLWPYVTAKLRVFACYIQ